MMEINAAVRIIRNHIFYYLREMRGGRNTGRAGLIEAANTIYDYANDKEKYKWHDLRKNPEDLPERGETVLVAYRFWDSHLSYKTAWVERRSYGSVWIEHGNAEFGRDMVTAWRYIEPFEEE